MVEQDILDVLVLEEMVWALKRRAKKCTLETSAKREALTSLLEQKSSDGTLEPIERIIWASFKMHARTPGNRRIYIQTEFEKLKKRAGEDFRKSLALMEN